MHQIREAEKMKGGHASAGFVHRKAGLLEVCHERTISRALKEGGNKCGCRAGRSSWVFHWASTIEHWPWSTEH